MSEPVPFDVISARIVARQEAGRRHREVMYRRGLVRNRRYALLSRHANREDEDVALIRRYEALKQARAEAKRDLRLAELVADQERDERTRSIGARWMLSLDEMRDSGDEGEGGRWTLHDVIPARLDGCT